MKTSSLAPRPRFDAVIAERRAADLGGASLAIDELRALRDVDAIAPPEAAQLAEPRTLELRPRPAAADHLRLPLATRHDGPTIRAAVARILGTDTSAPCPDADAVAKDEELRRALRAIDAALKLVTGRMDLTG